MLKSQLVLAAPASVELPAEIEFADLSGKALVLPSIHNGLRTIVDRIVARMHFTLNVLVDADSIHAQKLIARQCGCCMIKVFHTVAEEIEKGEISASRIVNPMIHRRVMLVTTHQRPLSRAAREVASRIECILKQLHQ